MSRVVSLTNVAEFDNELVTLIGLTVACEIAADEDDREEYRMVRDGLRTRMLHSYAALYDSMREEGHH